MRFFISFYCLAIIFIAGCSSKVSTTTSTHSGGKYAEDLSVLRAKIQTPSDTSKGNNSTSNTGGTRDPAKYVEARHAINASLDAVLDSIDRINLSNGLVDGFTIQLYSGIKREEALNVKKQLATSMPDMDADVQFVQPNFRVRSGKYLNRLDAHKDYMAVKKYFPNAVIIPDRIPIK